MSGRRSSRSDALPSTTAFLDQIRPARKAMMGAQAQLTISGPAYAAISEAAAALDRMAEALGHPGLFSTPPHSTPGPRR